MPQLVTYKNRPVKRRFGRRGGLVLLFHAAERGHPGDSLFVTDDEWRRFGQVTYYEPGTLPDIRALVTTRDPASFKT